MTRRRPIRVSAKTLKIPLTQGKYAFVDAEDLEKVAPYHWCAHRDGNYWYASTEISGKAITMHRLILELEPKRRIDHLDGNSLNNKKNNLKVQARRKPIRISDKTLKVPLTRGKFALIDAEDWDKISDHSWCAFKTSNGTWYAQARKRPHVLLMHRVIMGAKSGKDVDHREIQNTLDNRKSNLRFCTRVQGLWNKKKRSDSKAPYKGITFTRGYWVARISENKRMHVLGYFKDPIAAAKARDRGAKKYHGEFAYLNFPGDK